MLFFVDNMLPGDLVFALREMGYEARHTSRLGRVGGEDDGILSEAERVGAVVITKDADFLPLAENALHAKLIHIRFGNLTSQPTIERIVSELDHALKQLSNAAVAYIV